MFSLKQLVLISSLGQIEIMMICRLKNYNLKAYLISFTKK